jgi:hypothetical protein
MTAAPTVASTSWRTFKLPGRPGRLSGLPAQGEPMVQPLAIVAAEEIIGIGDVPVK